MHSHSREYTNMITYISPTSFSLYKEDPNLFYQRYISVNSRSLSREPQSQPMAVGAAFDAYIKAYLFSCLFGKNSEGSDRYEFDSLFMSMVEEQNRDWALSNGKYVFEQYKQSGALQDLMSALSISTNQRFEFDIYGQVHGYREGIQDTIINVPLGGKPDLSFIINDPATKEDVHVILDWKVNGYCSKYNISPTKGYVSLKSMNMDYGAHKTSIFTRLGPIIINLSIPLSEANESWASQMSIYSWLTGVSPGARFIVGIDQIVCNDSNGGLRLPSIKVASHRSYISEKFQVNLFNELHQLWEIISSKPFHFFRDLSLEDSQARCQMLDDSLISQTMIDNPNDPWFNSLVKR
jgi:hypothetical protein